MEYNTTYGIQEDGTKVELVCSVAIDGYNLHAQRCSLIELIIPNNTRLLSTYGNPHLKLTNIPKSVELIYCDKGTIDITTTLIPDVNIYYHL